MDVDKEAAEPSSARLDAAQLLDVERWRTLGTLVPSLVHGLSNPNGIILFNTGLLARLWPEIEAVLEMHAASDPGFKIGGLGHEEMKGEFRALVSGIQDAAQRVCEALAGVRDFARALEEPTSGSLDLNDIVRTTLAVAQRHIERHTEDFTVDLATDLPGLRGSRVEIGQALLALVQNACASLLDRTRSVRVRTVVATDRARVNLIVEDQGRGLPAEWLGRLGHEPYLNGENRAGLGLWIAHRIAGLHGGELSLVAREGGGTRATLALPAAPLELL